MTSVVRGELVSESAMHDDTTIAHVTRLSGYVRAKRGAGRSEYLCCALATQTRDGVDRGKMRLSSARAVHGTGRVKNRRLLLLLLLCLHAAGCGGRIRDDADSTQDSVAAPAATTPAATTPAATPPTAIDPFHAGDDWGGTYTCAQGLTKLDLRIVSMHGDVIDDATFDFDWASGGVRGSYHLSGSFDPATSTATFTPGEWIDYPGAMGGYSSWYAVGISGAASDAVFAGDVSNPACGTFTLARR